MECDEPRVFPGWRDPLCIPSMAPLPLIVYERRLDETDARPLAIAKGLTNPLYSPR